MAVNHLNAETLNLIARGFDPDPAEIAHLRVCPTCNRLLEEFKQAQPEFNDWEVVALREQGQYV